jgi:class 3 adenylate cyclase
VVSMAEWLQRLGVSEYAERFAENDVDQSDLRDLTDQDLRELGVSLGHRRRILRAIAACESDSIQKRSGPRWPTAKFCPECGQPIAASQTVAAREASMSSELAVKSYATAPARIGAPVTYTPRHLAEKILTSRSAIEGERKNVTALFADLKGSMELLADRDPEEARGILDPVLELMMDAIHYYEGTVSLVMGDGIVAIFGAPVAHEDHAVRACYAAVRMQESVQRHAEEVHRTQGIPIQIRVGLNSGEVVVRSVGSDLHMDYTAIGQTMHLAARMEQMAIPGTILAASGTMQLAEGYVVTKSLGPRPVKGLCDPVQVYEVLRATAVRSRLRAAAARGLTTFVGRTSELDLIALALQRAADGHGQTVALVGEAGVGKSRLIWEFTHSPRTQGCLIVESSSAPFGKSAAYSPLIDLIKAYFGVGAHEDARTVREKVAGKLFALDRALEPFLPAFLSMLDAPCEDLGWDKLDPPQRRQRTLDGIRRLLLLESRKQPVIVLFEDLHWIDVETQDFLNGLVECLPTARILLLVTYRPEYQHAWARKTYYREIRVDPLSAGDSDTILETLLGKAEALKPLKRLLFDRTEGNPFFIEECVRTLTELKFLDGERGAYTLLKPAESLQIPASAQAILTARIDRLAPEVKRALQAAAVIGREVPFALLAAIIEDTEHELRDSLSKLQAAELLYETTVFPDLEYTFRHSLTQEVAYNSLVHQRRRALHSAIVESIERLYPDRLNERVERLAHHAFRGELWDKVLRYARQAGRKALERSANCEAITFFEQALSAAQRLPNNREREEQEIDLRFDLRLGLMPLGEFGRTLELLNEAKGLATELNDQRRLGWIAAYMTNVFWELGEQDRAVESGRHALVIARSLEDGALLNKVNRYLGRSHYAIGDYRQAMTFLRR